ncbi:MAG: hypothetical protein E6Q97_21415 [Desulfurellales bacterium]|nr:MAG: hypothetical protein E6Q97_21415 [Desulfurellales bacterium]
MPNRLSQVFDRAASLLNDYWSEQNEHGDVIPLKYWRPGDASLPAIQWPAVVGEERVEQVYDDSEQATITRELLEFDVRTPLVVASGITAFQADAVFEWGGRQWSFDEANSFWNEEFVTFGVMRERLLHVNECRRADV